MQAENSWNIATRAEAARRTLERSGKVRPTDMAADARAFWWMLLALGLISAAAAAAPPPVVVAGATGRVGAAVVRSLIERRGGHENIFVLARDVGKAESMHTGVKCISADYGDVESLKVALSSVPQGFRIFVACNNGPAQAALEGAVCSAAQAAGCVYAVKLSTASPVLNLKEGGPYAAHLEVEEQLRQLALPHAVLRPNLFLDEVCLGGFMGVSAPLGASSECNHPFADAKISAVDVRDVGACAAALLDAAETDPTVGLKYEITGPTAISLGNELASAISQLRPAPVAIRACSIDDYIGARNLPPPVAANLAGFFQVLATECAQTTDVVQRLTGAKPRGVVQFVRDHAERFLPQSYQQLVGKRAASFRDAARVIERPMADDLNCLGADEMIIRVGIAGVNGGADTFSVTQPSDEDDKEIPLGKEGVGVVVVVGDDAAAAGFAPGQRVAFIGVGFTEYTRIKSRLAYAVDDSANPAQQTALRVSGHTAAVALGHTAPVRAGDVVVVTACCGATGSFAVQIAKAAGATVIGTVGSADKADVARRVLGVDRVVEYKVEDLGEVLRAEYPDGVDLAYEGVGGPLLGAICANLKPDGRVLVVGSSAPALKRTPRLDGTPPRTRGH